MIDKLNMLKYNSIISTIKFMFSNNINVNCVLDKAFNNGASKNFDFELVNLKLNVPFSNCERIQKLSIYNLLTDKTVEANDTVNQLRATYKRIVDFDFFKENLNFINNNSLTQSFVEDFIIMQNQQLKLIEDSMFMSFCDYLLIQLLCFSVEKTISLKSINNGGNDCYLENLMQLESILNDTYKSKYSLRILELNLKMNKSKFIKKETLVVEMIYLYLKYIYEYIYKSYIDFEFLYLDDKVKEDEIDSIVESTEKLKNTIFDYSGGFKSAIDEFNSELASSKLSERANVLDNLGRYINICNVRVEELEKNRPKVFKDDILDNENFRQNFEITINNEDVLKGNTNGLDFEYIKGINFYAFNTDKNKNKEFLNTLRKSINIEIPLFEKETVNLEIVGYDFSIYIAIIEKIMEKLGVTEQVDVYLFSSFISIKSTKDNKFNINDIYYDSKFLYKIKDEEYIIALVEKSENMLDMKEETYNISKNLVFNIEKGNGEFNNIVNIKLLNSDYNTDVVEIPLIEEELFDILENRLYIPEDYSIIQRGNIELKQNVQNSIMLEFLKSIVVSAFDNNKNINKFLVKDNAIDTNKLKKLISNDKFYEMVVYTTDIIMYHICKMYYSNYQINDDYIYKNIDKKFEIKLNLVEYSIKRIYNILYRINE